MSWITITVDDLEDAKVAALVTALRTAALGPGQDDPVERIIATVVARIRRKIASCAANQLDSDPLKIPSGLKEMSVLFIISSMKNRLEEPLTDDERNQLRTYESDLNRIADCKETVETPDDPIAPEVQSIGGTPSITEDRRETLRQNRSGL